MTESMTTEVTREGGQVWGSPRVLGKDRRVSPAHESQGREARGGRCALSDRISHASPRIPSRGCKHILRQKELGGGKPSGGCLGDSSVSEVMRPAPPAALSAHTQPCSQAPPASWEQHQRRQEREEKKGPHGREGVAAVRGASSAAQDRIRLETHASVVWVRAGQESAPSLGTKPVPL